MDREFGVIGSMFGKKTAKCVPRLQTEEDRNGVRAKQPEKGDANG